jgi:hypothetical protein
VFEIHDQGERAVLVFRWTLWHSRRLQKPDIPTVSEAPFVAHTEHAIVQTIFTFTGQQPVL